MPARREPQHGRNHWHRLRAFFVLAILACFVIVQSAAALSNHTDHDGATDHCCAACHGSHYPVVPTGTLVYFARLATAEWHQPNYEERVLSGEWTSVNSSRAPPA